MNSATDWLKSATAKYELKDYLGAIADYSKAIDLKPDDAVTYSRRGDAKHLLKDFQGAIGDFTKAIELKPDFADAYAIRGFAKYEHKDYQGAIADYTKAIELNPNDAVTYYYRGVAKCDLEDNQGAIADLTKAINLRPDYAGAYFNRGSAYFCIDEKDKALADFRRALELGVRVPQEVLDMCMTEITKRQNMDYSTIANELKNKKLTEGTFGKPLIGREYIELKFDNWKQLRISANPSFVPLQIDFQLNGQRQELSNDQFQPLLNLFSYASAVSRK